MNQAFKTNLESQLKALAYVAVRFDVKHVNALYDAADQLRHTKSILHALLYEADNDQINRHPLCMVLARKIAMIAEVIRDSDGKGRQMIWADEWCENAMTGKFDATYGTVYPSEWAKDWLTVP